MFGLSLKYNTALAPYKTEQSLQDIELQKKRRKRRKHIGKFIENCQKSV